MNLVMEMTMSFNVAIHFNVSNVVSMFAHNTSVTMMKMRMMIVIIVILIIQI